MRGVEVAVILVATLVVVEGMVFDYTQPFWKLMIGDYTLQTTINGEAQQIPVTLYFGVINLENCDRDIGYYTADVQGKLTFDSLWVSTQTTGCTDEQLQLLIDVRANLAETASYSQDENAIVLLDESGVEIGRLIASQA